MSHENVVSIQLAEGRSADELLGALREAHDQNVLRLHAAVVVRVVPGGEIEVGEIREAPGAGMRRGGAAGGILGVLGGPLGMLAGWGIGARMGEGLDAGDAAREEDALVSAVHDLPEGSTALVAEVEEQPDNEPRLDALALDLGATTVRRRRTDDLLAEFEARTGVDRGPAGPAERGARLDALRARLEAEGS